MGGRNPDRRARGGVALTCEGIYGEAAARLTLSSRSAKNKGLDRGQHETFTPKLACQYPRVSVMLIVLLSPEPGLWLPPYALPLACAGRLAVYRCSTSYVIRRQTQETRAGLRERVVQAPAIASYVAAFGAIYCQRV